MKYILVFCLFLIANFGHSKEVYVNAISDDGGDGTSWANAFNNLQDAIASADSGDTLKIAEGVYKPTSGMDRLATFNLKGGISLSGGYAGNGSDERDREKYITILSGDLQGNDNEIMEMDESTRSDNSIHVVSAIDFEQQSSVVDLVITGGNANMYDLDSTLGYGAGVYCINANLYLNCVLEKNTSEKTGCALFSRNSVISMQGCRLTGNFAGYWNSAIGTIESDVVINFMDYTGDGGCISVYSGTVEMSNIKLVNGGFNPNVEISRTTKARVNDCLFENNTSSSGIFEIREAGTDNLIKNSKFLNNSADNWGGAVFVDGSTTVAFEGCDFIGNSIVNEGGGAVGVRFENDVSFKNCIFDNNRAGVSGAAVMFFDDSSARFEGCLFSENKADVDGGSIYYENSVNAVLVNCTFYGNTASGKGGALAVPNLGIVNNCIFWGNSASLGAQIYNLNNPLVPFDNVSYCIIEGGYLGSNMVAGLPVFLSSVPAGFDGVFRTLDDGLRLHMNSDGIDTGSNELVQVIIDLGYNQRIQEGTIDLGAYEGANESLDIDDDDLWDIWELVYFPDDLSVLFAGGDYDQDGLNDGQEQQYLTNPTVKDSDNDLLEDDDELSENSDPLNPDTDGDKMEDGYEVLMNLNPIQADGLLDSDNDGVKNIVEYYYKTDPGDPDSIPVIDLRAYTAMELEWNSVDGVFYQLQESEDFQNWIDVGGPVEGSLVDTIFLSIHDDDKKFYRLRIANPQ